MTLPLSDRINLTALFALLLGMLLLDRGFANWRNDPRSFPGPDGHALPVPPDAPPQTYVEQHHLMKAMEYSGAGLIALSVVLFGLRVNPSRSLPDGPAA